MESPELFVVSSRSYTLKDGSLLETTEESDSADTGSERMALVLPREVADQLKAMTADDRPLAIMLLVATTKEGSNGNRSVGNGSI
jgi:hypothetical protein